MLPVKMVSSTTLCSSRSRALKDAGYCFDIAHTSVLQRAQRTLGAILDQVGKVHSERHFLLNLFLLYNSDQADRPAREEDLAPEREALRRPHGTQQG